ncbi:histidine kinase [Rhodanobacter sp. B04]|uniref:FecR family protein n=1 Tax=Rhodanobacter sp. B04 TaxID=1945860 RepID=UPI00098481DC|nr:FecR domain-containing protein [Rhodanobacter sp. B04]OOG61674.1 histidine kinase [Rhodanobacter sp. B04]
MTSSRQIELTASAWLAKRDAGAWSAHDQSQLDAWLAASVAHRVAFLRLDAAWRQSDRLKALGAGVPAGVVPARGTWGVLPSHGPREVHGTVEAQLDRSQHDAPTGSNPARFMSGPPKENRRRLLRYAVGAVALVMIVSLALGWRRYSAVDQALYRTAVGGLQDVPLADGSVVTLSSDSRMLVTLSRGERRIDLQQGEAFFKVAKDPDRPFVVSAGERRAIAVGTRYDVRRDAADLRVIVTQGVVRLESDNGPDGHRQPTTLLPAGSIALASDTGVVVQSGSMQQAEELLNWRNGFISFHDTPLAAAAAEFNRYNTRKIVIGDASVGAIRVGGNFRWSNADSFVRLLELGFPVQAVRSDKTIVLKRR